MNPPVLIDTLIASVAAHIAELSLPSLTISDFP